jgi:hypothetical protein
MIISDVNKFIFIHIPKTGGTSISSSLINYGDSHPWKHQLARKFSNKKYQDYFKFSFVRNPWERLVSMYHYKFSEMLSYNKKFVIPFEEFIKFMFSRSNEFYSSQWDFVSKNNLNLMDFIGRSERIQKDFDTICDKIKIPKSTLSHAVKSGHKHYTEYYNKELEGIVKKEYAMEIEYFNYKFGELESN